MSELEDPTRLYDKNPKAAFAKVLSRQIEMLSDLSANQQLLAEFIKNPDVIAVFPEDARRDPLVIAETITSLREMVDGFKAYYVSLILLGTLFIEKEEMKELIKGLSRRR